MTIEKTAIEDLLIINPTVFEDSRGYFFEAYNKAKFQKNGINYEFIQDNHPEDHNGGLFTFTFCVVDSEVGSLCLFPR